MMQFLHHLSIIDAFGKKDSKSKPYTNHLNIPLGFKEKLWFRHPLFNSLDVNHNVRHMNICFWSMARTPLWRYYYMLFFKNEFRTSANLFPLIWLIDRYERVMNIWIYEWMNSWYIVISLLNHVVTSWDKSSQCG